MIWSGRRDHMGGYMTPLAGMNSSLVGEARGSLEQSSIPRPSGSVMLRKRYKKKQNKRSVQRTLRKAQMYGGFTYLTLARYGRDL